MLVYIKKYGDDINVLLMNTDFTKREGVAARVYIYNVRYETSVHKREGAAVTPC